MYPVQWALLRQAALGALSFGTITIMVYVIVQGSLTVLMAYLLFGLVGLALVWRGGSTLVQIYLTIYGLAVVFAVILTWIYTYSYGVPYWGGGSDEIHYEEVGLQFAQQYDIFDYNKIRDEVVYAWHNSVGYIYLVSLLVKFSEFFDNFHTMIPRIFNITCLALNSVLIYMIGLRLGLQYKTAVIAAIFSGCLPLMIWVSVQTLRDIPQTLLLVTLVFLWLPNQYGHWRYSVLVLLVLSIFILIPIWEIRKAQAFVGLFLVASAIFLNRRSFKFMRFCFITIPIFLIGIFIIYQFYTTLHIDILNFLNSIDSYLELRRRSGIEGSLSLVVFEKSLFPIGWLYKIIYALMSPIPVIFWPLYNAWLSLGTVIHILFLPFFWRGLCKSLTNSQWRLILIAFILLFIGMSIFTFTIRHITQWLPFAILLSALGYDQYRGSPHRIWSTMAIIILGLGLLYLYLKNI